MTIIIKNQNDIMDLEQEYIYSNSPINRIISKTTAKNKFLELDRLKKKIESIENCELKKMLIE